MKLRILLSLYALGNNVLKNVHIALTFTPRTTQLVFRRYVAKNLNGFRREVFGASPGP